MAETKEKETLKRKKEAKFSDDRPGGSSSSSSSEKAPSRHRRAYDFRFREWFKLPTTLQWIPANSTWSKWKVTIRCAVAGWVSSVLFVIPAVQIYMGQASFLILISAFLSPPSDPFLSVFEREVLIIGFVAATWAWCCLGMFLANLARKHRDPSVSIIDAILSNGEYVEAGPTVILAVFVFIGTAVLLFIRARKGPGPYLFATLFACICLDIILTTSAIIPYAYYRFGVNIIVPLGFHSVVSLLCSFLLFPQSISASYTARLQPVFTPLIQALSLHRTLLETPSTSPEFVSTVSRLSALVKASEAALVPAAAAGRLLKSDLVYARFAPGDFAQLRNLSRRLAVRANGMIVYWGLVDSMRERFPGTPGPSRVGSPGPTPGPSVVGTPVVRSRAPSPERGFGGSEDVEDTPPGTPIGTRGESRMSMGADTDRGDNENSKAYSSSIPESPRDVNPRRHSGVPASHSHSHSQSQSQSHPHYYQYGQDHKSHNHHSHHHSHHRNHHSLLHNSLLHLSLPRLYRHHSHSHSHRDVPSATVGVFESQRYLDLESRYFHDPMSDVYTEQSKELLARSCDGLLEGCGEAAACVKDWLGSVRDGRWEEMLSRWTGWFGKTKEKGKGDRNAEWRRKRIEGIQKVREKLGELLDRFKESERHLVLEPYRLAFEPLKSDSEADDSDAESSIPSHRYLFHCYVYQYHLMRFSTMLVEMLDIILQLERTRTRARLWTPVERIFKWSGWELDGNDHEEEDPERIQGIGPEIAQDLGLPQRRDPDALPPKNGFEKILRVGYEIVVGLGGGNALYAVKAAVLTTIMCLPSFLKSSAAFAYNNRFVWGVIMAQVTGARFRGDTTYNQVWRIASTFMGGVVGMVMWYISTGNGNGNSYGLAAVFAVCFPFFFFARLYWPGPPMRILIFFVTTVLVVGYSWQDEHIVLPGNPGVGWDVAWRRFLLVSSGVTAAFIFSFFPPAFTLRRYQRTALSTTCTELGAIYCAIISYANSRNEEESQEIVLSLIAVRSKLNRLAAMRANVKYEFSFRGRWPEQRYQRMLELQLQLAYHLSHLLSVVEHLEPAWTRAFLSRTRFIDPSFQGDMLAVISMISTALRTGNSLPQITPCPLIDRYMLRYHGLNVIHREAEEDYGLPRTLSKETLIDAQYMMFCVGVSTAFGIVTRLDRLMLAAKEIVGEQYHIHGVGVGFGGQLRAGGTGTGVPMGSRTNTYNYSYRPPQEV